MLPFLWLMPQKVCIAHVHRTAAHRARIKACPHRSRPISNAGKFEEGMAKSGQTRTHALLAYAFGIRSVVVAITQLDNLVIPYSRKRYEWCQSEILRYLKRVGFVQDRVACVPVSGLCGDNIIEPSKNMPWCELLCRCVDAAELVHLCRCVGDSGSPWRGSSAPCNHRSTFCTLQPPQH
jgi:hypothetical protein